MTRVERDKLKVSALRVISALTEGGPAWARIHRGHIPYYDNTALDPRFPTQKQSVR